MKEVSIYLRRSQFEVIIPADLVWVFMLEFGRAFPINHSDGSKNVTPVDNYHDHPNGWHVTVTVAGHQESEFLSFLESFSEKNGVEFKPQARCKSL